MLILCLCLCLSEIISRPLIGRKLATLHTAPALSRFVAFFWCTLLCIKARFKGSADQYKGLFINCVIFYFYCSCLFFVGTVVDASVGNGLTFTVTFSWLECLIV